MERRVYAPSRVAYRLGFAHPEHELRGPDAEVAALLDHAARLGATWLRTDAYWNAVEGVQGVYDWTNLDRVTSMCQARGLFVILCAHTMPEWARTGGAADPASTGPTTTAQVDAFAQFCAALTTRCPDAVVEVWNEPNLDQFWGPTPDPDAYVAALRAAYAAMKAANPDVYVLGCCFGGAQAAPDIATQPFYEGVRDAGGLRYLDGVSHHPYDASGRAGGGLAEATAIRRWLDRDGYRGNQIWGTECGTASAGGQGQTEAVQARAPLEAHRHWANIRAGGPLCWYTIRDGITDDVGTSASAPIRADGTDKPVAAVMRQLAAATTVPGMVPTVAL